MSKRFIPIGFHTVNPYVIVTGAQRFIEFAQTVADARVSHQMNDPSGVLRHAALRIGDSVVETAEAREQWPSMPASLHVYVPNVDDTYKKALAAGAESLAEPTDHFYGERGASVRDPVGNLWHFATLIEDLSEKELLKRAAAQQG